MRTLVDIPQVLVDARAARAELRRQIAHLEASGAQGNGGGGGPRLLSLGELEVVRDALLARTSRSTDQDRYIGTFAAERRLERMFADPARHRRDSVSLSELGRPGCGVYSVRPRLGLIGMLAGWWQITLSSGCP
jgi:hypothetical protein